MAYTLWIGKLSPHPHEKECLIKLIKTLDRLDEKYYIFANFSVPYEIDLAILKQDAIFIIEIKSKNAYQSIFRPRLNGSWEYLGSDGAFYPFEINGPNYFYQVNKQFYALRNYLKANKAIFLDPQKASQIQTINVNLIIAINPTYRPAPEAEVDPRIKVVGFDKLHEELFTKSSKYFSLTEEEITRLAEDVLHLKRTSLEALLKPMIIPEELDWEGYCRNLKKELEGDEELFVDPGIYEIKVDDKNPYRRTPIPSDFIEFLASNPCTVLIGPAGSGKTTYLKHLCSLNSRIFLIKKDSAIPLSISLDQYRSENGGLWRLIQNAFARRSLDIDLDDLKMLFSRKENFIFFFDALEEIDSRELKIAKSELNDLSSDFPSIKRIFAVREKESMQFLRGCKEAYLNLFGKDEIKELLSIYALKIPGFNLGILKQKIDTDFLRLPFHINSLLNAWLENSSSLELTEIPIYENAISHYIKRELERHGINQKHAFDIERILSQLAFRFYQKRAASINDLKLPNLVEAAYEDLSKKNIISVKLTDAIDVIDSLPLLKKEDGFISFQHAYFKEHLAAKELGRRLSFKESDMDLYLSDLFLKDVLIRAVNFLPDEDVFLKEVDKKSAYLFLAGFLEGKGGEKAKSFAKRFVEMMLGSEAHDERVLALRIIGQARNTFFSFSKLLSVLDKEEKRIKVRYKDQMHKCEEYFGLTELSVENIISDQNGSLPWPEKLQIRKEDFRIYEEAAYFLRELRGEKNPASFVEILSEIDRYGVSARGYVVEVLGSLQLSETDAQIFDFLESRLNDSIERSLLVRCAAYWSLFDNSYWNIRDRFKSIIHRQFENPTCSEDWHGFPIDYYDYLEENTLLNLEQFLDLPAWIDEIESLLRNIEFISENDLSLIYDILNAVGGFIANPSGNDQADISKTVSLLSLRYIDTKISPSVKNPFSVLDNNQGSRGELLEISISLVSLIAFVGKPNAFELLIKLTISGNAFLSLIGQLGIEILIQSNPADEVMNRYKLHKVDIDNSIRLLFEKHALPITSTLIALNQQNQKFAASKNLNLFDIIIGLLNKPYLERIVEDTILILLSHHSDHNNKLYDILEHIGSSRTANKLKKQIIGLKIDPDPWNRILELINALEE